MKNLYLSTAAILLTIPAAFATDGITVIKTENGPVRINTSDFDATKHELHVANDQHDEHGVARGSNDGLASAANTVNQIMSPTATTGDTATNMDKFGVMQVKNKFFIVDGANAGKVVDDVEGIDPKGYPDNQTAWNVLIAVRTPKPATDNA